jgi:hypothetical protein
MLLALVTSVSDSSILMYVLGTSEYNAYLIIDEQACKERGDDLDSNGLLSFDIGGVLVILVEQIWRVGSSHALDFPFVEGFGIDREPLWGSTSLKDKVAADISALDQYGS